MLAGREKVQSARIIVESQTCFPGVVGAKARICKPKAFASRKFLSVCLAIAIAAVPLIGIAQSRDRDVRGLPRTSATAPPPEARIDINRASVEELLQVPGMTRSWAGRIVRFRPYRTKVDLVDRGVITAEVYERIKDSVIAHRVPD
jgi:hypothetical protein